MNGIKIKNAVIMVKRQSMNENWVSLTEILIELSGLFYTFSSDPIHCEEVLYLDTLLCCRNLFLIKYEHLLSKIIISNVVLAKIVKKL